jgi:hypothetical protein
VRGGWAPACALVGCTQRTQHRRCSGAVHIEGLRRLRRVCTRLCLAVAPPAGMAASLLPTFRVLAAEELCSQVLHLLHTQWPPWHTPSTQLLTLLHWLHPLQEVAEELGSESTSEDEAIEEEGPEGVGGTSPGRGAVVRHGRRRSAGSESAELSLSPKQRGSSISTDMRGQLAAQLQEMSLPAGTYLVEVGETGAWRWH